MSAINLDSVIHGIRELHQNMELDDAAYYAEAVEKLTDNLIRFGSSPGIKSVNYHDLFAQQEIRSLNAVQKENDIHHKMAMFIGICDTANQDGTSPLPVMGGEDSPHDSLADHILSNVTAAQDDHFSTDKLSDHQVSELKGCVEELRSFQGTQPHFVIKRWLSRNAMGERLGIGLDVDQSVINRIDQSIKGAVRQRPARQQEGPRPAPGVAPSL